MKKNFFKFAALMMAAATLVVACSDDKTEDGGKGGQNALGAPVVFLERQGATLNVEWEYVSGAKLYEVNANVIGEVDSEGTVTNYAEENVTALLESPKVTENLTETLTLNKGYVYEVQVVATAEGRENSEVGTATTMYYVAAMMYEGGELAALIAADVEEKAANDELEVSLLAGAEYSLESTLDLGLHSTKFVVKKWDETNKKYVEATAEDKRPIVVMGELGRLRTASGLQISGVNFDCTAQVLTPGDVDYGFITMSATYYPEREHMYGNLKIQSMVEPIVVANCNIKDLPSSFFIGGINAWGIESLTIDNCIIQARKEGGLVGNNYEFVNFMKANQTGEEGTTCAFAALRVFTIKNSTIYGLGDNGARFYRWTNQDNIGAGNGTLFASGDKTTQFVMTNTTLHGWSNQADNFAHTKLDVVEMHDNVLYNAYAFNKLIRQGTSSVDLTKTNPETNIAWSPYFYKDGEGAGVAGGDTEAALVTGVELKFTGTEPTELNLEDDVKGGQSFAYTCEKTLAGDPRWK